MKNFVFQSVPNMLFFRLDCHPGAGVTKGASEISLECEAVMKYFEWFVSSPSVQNANTPRNIF